MALRRASPGQPVSASAWNQLVAAIESVLARRFENPARFGGQDNDHPLPAVITRVYGTPDANGMVLASALRYDYQMRSTLATVINAAPDYGRPFELTPAVAAVLRLKPAAVDDQCWVIRTKNADGTSGNPRFWAPTEKLGLAVCTAPGPAMTPAELIRAERKRAMQLNDELGPDGPRGVIGGMTGGSAGSASGSAEGGFGA